jgi:formylglycine-generating enzyme required for sulfatase activity
MGSSRTKESRSSWRFVWYAVPIALSVAITGGLAVKYLKPEKPPGEATEKAAGDVVAKVKDVSSIELVAIPNGSFYMGSPDGDTDANGDEKPQHKVTISRPFNLGKYKVTRGQFRRFAEANPTFKTEAEKAGDEWTWQKPGFLGGAIAQFDDHPVVRVSWNDADAFCRWLAEITGANVRLPYEAE